jgi:hypothetical protein
VVGVPVGLGLRRFGWPTTHLAEDLRFHVVEVRDAADGEFRPHLAAVPGGVDADGPRAHDSLDRALIGVHVGDAIVGDRGPLAVEHPAPVLYGVVGEAIGRRPVERRNPPREVRERAHDEGADESERPRRQVRRRREDDYSGGDCGEADDGERLVEEEVRRELLGLEPLVLGSHTRRDEQRQNTSPPQFPPRGNSRWGGAESVGVGRLGVALAAGGDEDAAQ